MDQHKQNESGKYALFIGMDHPRLIETALASGDQVCIALAGADGGEQNPVALAQQRASIARVYGERVRVVELPAIKSIQLSRQAGYDIAIEGHSPVQSGASRACGNDGVGNSTIWFTGLPCAGKSTLAQKVKERLDARGVRSVYLDADEIRTTLSKDLGFSAEDRRENLRRVAHVARMFNDNGNVVLASFVSPTEAYRAMIKEIIGRITLVFVKCSLSVCEQRDVKGMYKKARNGQLSKFTGVSDLFEDPVCPDIVVDTERGSVEACAREILRAWEKERRTP